MDITPIVTVRLIVADAEFTFHQSSEIDSFSIFYFYSEVQKHLSQVRSSEGWVHSHRTHVQAAVLQALIFQRQPDDCPGSGGHQSVRMIRSGLCPPHYIDRLAGCHTGPELVSKTLQ